MASGEKERGKRDPSITGGEEDTLFPRSWGTRKGKERENRRRKKRRKRGGHSLHLERKGEKGNKGKTLKYHAFGGKEGGNKNLRGGIADLTSICHRMEKKKRKKKKRVWYSFSKGEKKKGGGTVRNKRGGG